MRESKSSIQLEHVEKWYGNKKVLEDITFDVKPGSIFGLLGPNGAGKSTTLRILTGLVRCSKGDVKVLGFDPWSERKKLVGRVGVLLDAAFPKYMSGQQNLSVLGRIGKVGAEEQSETLRYVGLEKSASQPVGSYSFGMTQRLGLAQALLGNPSILILDEPMVGLDPAGIDDLKELLVQLARRGVTVVFSSHQLVDTEEICDEIAVINRGRTVYSGRVEEAVRSIGYRLQVDLPHRVLMMLEGWGVPAQSDGDELIVQVPRGDEFANLFGRLSQEGCRILHVEPIRNTLYDLFMQQVEGGA